MAPRLFIHIGTHKTGSTSIQRTLAGQKKALLGLSVREIPVRQGELRLVTAPNTDSKMLEDLRQRVLAHQKQSGVTEKTRFVMSYEGFSGRALQGYANAAKVAKNLQQVCRDFDVRVLVYLRRQDGFIESLYTQQIHEGGHESFGEFMAARREVSFDWSALLQAYGEVFGRSNLIVRRYDRAFLPEPTSLLSDFFDLLGVRLADLVLGDSVEKNRGYSRDALELARLCNPALGPEEKQRFRRLLQAASTKGALESYSYMSAAERAEIEEKYQASNGLIAQEFFPDAGGALFPPLSDKNLREREYPGLQFEKAIPQLVALFLEHEKSDSLHQSKLLHSLVSLEGRLKRLWGRIFG